MLDILEGLEYLHVNGIIHADIKLENILANKVENVKLKQLKLCDFGLSQLVDEKGEVKLTAKIGTGGYMAPEVQAGAIVTPKIDLWSTGVVLYKMSVGYKPTQVKAYKYGSGPIPFRRVDWKTKSPELQDLITRMLEMDPLKRINVREALEHKWFQI